VFRVAHFIFALIALLAKLPSFKSAATTDLYPQLDQDSAWLDGTKHRKTESEESPTGTHAISRQFSFNVSQEQSSSREWHLKESSLYDDTRSVRGSIKVQRGDILQTSDIEVLALMQSDHEAAFHDVFFNPTDSSLSIDSPRTTTNFASHST
jgi:hypothetical protein